MASTASNVTGAFYDTLASTASGVATSGSDIGQTVGLYIIVTLMGAAIGAVATFVLSAKRMGKNR